MKPVKCGNCTKFYDADKYESCPHCNAGGTTSSTSIKKEATFSDVNTDKPKVAQQEIKSRKLFGKLRSEKLEKKNSSIEGSGGDAERTEILSGNISEMEVSVNYATEEKTDKNIGYDDVYSDSSMNSAQSAATDFETEPDVMPISEAVKRADAVQSSTDQKTVAFYNFSNDIEPVVGWLVCIKGEYQGASFNLKSGKNNIGRALTMDVALAQEKSVSRERHASITFEPHQKKFFVQSGDGNGLTYVNKELLMMFRELQPYDIISLGACDLMFLPLCGEQFTWEDHM